MGSPRQDITLEERIGIGLVATANRGDYGVVSGLAREYGTSRQFVYRLEKRVVSTLGEALSPRRPGPAAAAHLLEIDRLHLDRSILTLAMVGHASERAICECLGSILKVRPSLGYVSGVLTRAAEAASNFNEGLGLALPAAEVEIDELYAQGKANLVAVHPDSFLILAARQTRKVNGQSWEGVVDDMAGKGLRIARLASDGGAAIRAMVAGLVGVVHQLDLWHALRHVGRAVVVLERTAYKAIARQDELERKARKFSGSVLLGGVVSEDYRRAKEQARLDIDRYDGLRVLAGWVHEALDPIEARSGRLRSRAECLEELSAATELMRELAVPTARKLAAYLDDAGPGLLTYLDGLKESVGELFAELGEEGVRLLCREWALEKRLGRGGDGAKGQRDYLRAHLLSLLYWGDAYPGASRRLSDLLGSALRGSSLVECVNSLLRPYADLRRSLGQSFLELFTLYRNAHVFARGKRAGSSPFQLAGITTPEGDWMDWLGYGHDERPRRALRCLPKAA